MTVWLFGVSLCRKGGVVYGLWWYQEERQSQEEKRQVSKKKEPPITIHIGGGITLQNIEIYHISCKYILLISYQQTFIVFSSQHQFFIFT